MLPPDTPTGYLSWVHAFTFFSAILHGINFFHLWASIFYFLIGHLLHTFILFNKYVLVISCGQVLRYQQLVFQWHLPEAWWPYFVVLHFSPFALSCFISLEIRLRRIFRIYHRKNLKNYPSNTHFFPWRHKTTGIVCVLLFWLKLVLSPPFLALNLSMRCIRDHITWLSVSICDSNLSVCKMGLGPLRGLVKTKWVNTCKELRLVGKLIKLAHFFKIPLSDAPAPRSAPVPPSLLFPNRRASPKL